MVDLLLLLFFFFSETFLFCIFLTGITITPTLQRSELGRERRRGLCPVPQQVRALGTVLDCRPDCGGGSGCRKKNRKGSWVYTADEEPQSATIGGSPQLCAGTTFLRATDGPEALAGEAELLVTPSPWVQEYSDPWKNGSPNPPTLERKEAQPKGHSVGLLFQG